MIKHLLSLVMIALVATALSACGAKQYPEPEDPVRDAETLLANIEQRGAEIQRARVRAVMEYFGAEGRVRVRQTLLVQQPGGLRLETMSPFDSTLALVVSNADELTYYDLANEKVYSGRPTAENLAKLIPLWLAPADIVDVVLGGVPLRRVDHELTSWKLTWDSKRNAWKLFGRGLTGGQLELFVRHGTWSLAGAREVDREGKLQWEIRTADFRTVGDGEVQTEVPSRIRFLMPSESLDVSLNVSEYELNPELDEMLFEVFTPDLEIIPLDGTNGL